MPNVTHADAGSDAYCQLKTTSSAVNGLPSCHCTPRLSFQVTDLPSAASPPFSRLGISAASTGKRSPSGSQRASGSWKMREASCSLVPVAKCGLSNVGPCHQSTLSAPPPPRLVGLYWNFSSVAAAAGRPEKVSIWAAIGAVSPSATICCTNDRRESLPFFTSAMRPRSAFSSMEIPHAGWLSVVAICHATAGPTQAKQSRFAARSTLRRQLRLYQPDPVRRPVNDRLVVEVVGRVMQAGRVTVADEDEGAGLLLQHEGEILGAEHRRRVCIDVGLACHFRRHPRGDIGLGGMVHQHRVAGRDNRD